MFWPGFKISNFNIFGGFQKKECFWVLRFCGYFLGGHHNIGLYLGVSSMHFRSFLRSSREWGIFFRLLEFQFFGVLEIPCIYWG